MRAGGLDERLLLKLLAQGKQAGTQGGAKETEVTDLHKATGEDMLQETVNELFSRERAVFELAGLGSPILESDQGRFHVSGVHHLGETAIANGHAGGCQEDCVNGNGFRWPGDLQIGSPVD